MEWLEWLRPGPLVLLHSCAATDLATFLLQTVPDRFRATLVASDGTEPVDDAWRAPFPDRGYEAGLRALGRASPRVSGPSVAQAHQFAALAMGYCTS